MNKKNLSKRLFTIALCLAVIIAFVPLSSLRATAAETEVKSTLDFSTMPAQDNVASSVQLIKDAGAVDAVNLFVAGNHTPVANPGGYMGEGYYIQKLDAGAGNTFKEVYLDLIYWVGTAVPQGYLKVYASTDNASYTEIFSQTEGNGDPWMESTRQSISIPIDLAKNAQTVYIKVVMQHWTTWEGAAVKTSTLRGVVEKNESAAPPPTIPDDTPSKTISATFDFSAMATDTVKEEVRQDLMGYGLYDCGNVQIGGNYGNVATPGGYAGEGYVIHKLSAPEGQTLLSAQLELKYWAYNVGGNMPGYLVVMASADGRTYEEITEIEGAAQKSTVQTYTVDLPMAAGAKEIYVKIIMQHWESYEGAAVKKITINGRIPSDGEDISDERHKVELFQAFNGLPYGEVSAQDIGADSERNMFFGIDGVALLTPRGGYETAYAVWKLSAVKGEALDDAIFRFMGRTWYMTPDQKDNNTLKILVSTDGTNFTEVECYHSNDEQSDTQIFESDLTAYVAGASEVYVKMEWLLFDSPHVMGIRSVTLIGNTKGKEDSADRPTKTPVSNVQSFTSLSVGAVSAAQIGADKCANLVFGPNRTPVLTAAQSGQDAFAIWELQAAPGETFDNGYLTLVGKITYTDPSKKDYTFIKVLISTDGENFAEVDTLRPVDDDADTLKGVMDLSSYIRGCTKAYVKLFWFTEEDPSVFGLRSLSFVANAGNRYDSYTPPVEDVTWPDDEPTGPMPTDPTPTEPVATQQGTGNQEPDPSPADNSLPLGAVIALCALGAVAVIAGCFVLGFNLGRKESRGK